MLGVLIWGVLIFIIAASLVPCDMLSFIVVCAILAGLVLPAGGHRRRRQ